MSLLKMCEKYEQKHGLNTPLPEFIYDFLFKHYDDPMDKYDPMDVVDGLIANRIHGSKYNLPTDINIFDFRGGGFTRHHTPMVVVDGMKGLLWWNYMVPVSISETPTILIAEELLQKRSNLSPEEWDMILGFIALNHEKLMAQWNCTLSESELNLGPWTS